MANYVAYDWDGNAFQCKEYGLSNGDNIYIPRGLEDEYENYVKLHGEKPSVEWAKESYNTEEFEWEKGFEPENLSEVVAVAIDGDQAYHVGDADIEIDIALDVALDGWYMYSKEDADKDEYLDMAERLDFSADNLPDTIYESKNYYFACL